jgi:hypothetical protein
MGLGPRVTHRMSQTVTLSLLTCQLSYTQESIISDQKPPNSFESARGSEGGSPDEHNTQSRDSRPVRTYAARCR